MRSLAWLVSAVGVTEGVVCGVEVVCGGKIVGVGRREVWVGGYCKGRGKGGSGGRNLLW